MRLRLEMGRYVLAEDYVRAMQLRDVLELRVDRALESCDALLLPSLPMAAPLLGATTVAVGDRHEPVRAVMLRLTQLFNVTGHPAIAMPAGMAARRAAARPPAGGRRGRHAAAAGDCRGSRASDLRRPRIGRRRHRVNVRSIANIGIRSPGGSGLFTGGGCLMTSGACGTSGRGGCSIMSHGNLQLRDRRAIASELRCNMPAASRIDKNVSVEDANAKQAEGYTYVDVRSIPEFELGHPAGAVNVPLLHRDQRTGQMMPNREFLDVMRANFPSDAKLLIGCQVGARSAQAAQILTLAGFTDVFNVARRLRRRARPDDRRVRAEGWVQAACRRRLGSPRATVRATCTQASKGAVAE